MTKWLGTLIEKRIIFELNINVQGKATGCLKQYQNVMQN